jgi:hypothetical protein
MGSLAGRAIRSDGGSLTGDNPWPALSDWWSVISWPHRDELNLWDKTGCIALNVGPVPISTRDAKTSARTRAWLLECPRSKIRRPQSAYARSQNSTPLRSTERVQHWRPPWAIRTGAVAR